MSSPAPSKPTTVPVNRTLVGLISLVCLLTSGVLYLAYGSNEDWEMWRGGFMRVGLLMGAFWQALPTKSRDAAWAQVSPLALIGGLVALFIAVRRPKVFIPLFVIVGAILFVLRLLRRGDPGRPDRSSWS
ncbi:hypothetical protein GC176_22905 [bacterium]|nr:hypothetical protein [bacterium]